MKSQFFFAIAVGLMNVATLAHAQGQPKMVVSQPVVDGVRLEVRRNAGKPVRGKYLVTLNDASAVYDRKPPYRAIVMTVDGNGKVDVVRKFVSSDFGFWAVDLKLQPDGLYTYAINRPSPPLWGYELRVLDPKTDREVMEIKGYPPRDLSLDGHETIVYHGDNRLFLYYRRRDEPGRMYWDMEVARLSAKSGEVVNRWTSKGLFPAEATGDYLHFNSLYPISADQVLASARSTSTLYVINLASGKIDDQIDSKSWKVIDDPLGGFARQHDAHFLENGNLLLYDNRDEKEEKPNSRAVEYAVDWKARTLKMVWERRAEASMPFRLGWGSVKAVRNDERLIAWGDIPRTKGDCATRTGNFPVFSHVARDSTPILELRAPCGWVTYRAYFVPSP